MDIGHPISVASVYVRLYNLMDHREMQKTSGDD